MTAKNAAMVFLPTPGILRRFSPGKEGPLPSSGEKIFPIFSVTSANEERTASNSDRAMRKLGYTSLVTAGCFYFDN